MTILVKNEADIIAHNIKFHAKVGVNGFCIMDNGSTDGTLDIIHTLMKSYDIKLISNPENNYQQSKWMTGLAKLAKKEMAADFVISNDADEFWLPDENMQFSDILFRSDSVVTVSRQNMLFTEDILHKDYHYSQSQYCISKPVNYSVEDQINSDNVCMQFVPISPKVIVNPRGLIKIKGGNHRAKHMRYFLKRTEPRIQVFHYPVRSYERFLNNIENRVKLLNQGARMGPHYKRWVKYYNQGGLEQEFQRMAVKVKDIPLLCQFGLIRALGSYQYKAINSSHCSL